MDNQTQRQLITSSTPGSIVFAFLNKLKRTGLANSLNRRYRRIDELVDSELGELILCVILRLS